MKALRDRSLRADIIVVLCLLFAVAGFLTSGLLKVSSPEGEMGQTKAVKYVCPMNISYHPYFSSTDPEEKCGYCGMDLVADSGTGGDEEERALVMSKSALKLAEVSVKPVQRRFVDLEIPLTGKIDFDETRVKTISSWVDGRLDRLFADYTGIRVNEGDHLVEIYSPTLYSAQEELLQAVKNRYSLPQSASQHVKDTSQRTLQAVREKLKLLGFSEFQINELEKKQKPSARIEIKAPIGGVVIHKNAKEGMYVETGSAIYTVADMSQLWVKLDAYESDLPWLKYGQKVDIKTEAFGDRVFKGWVSFIDPVLDSMSRTVKVRVVVENTDGLLRPNMFVRAVVKARVSQEGVVSEMQLEGKWICPMHPEIIKNTNVPCDLCGMDLVPASETGLDSPVGVTAPLVVPASSVLLTGRRSIVYVRKPNEEMPTFEGRHIELGPRAGDHYIVEGGLSEGEEVVVNGHFKIDSALQLKAKPSMMSPDGASAGVHDHSRHQARSTSTPEDVVMRPQAKCPIMGGAVNREVYIDYKGLRIYFCCPGCDKPFMEDPDGYLEKMKAAGVKLEKTPVESETNHEGHGH